MIGELLIEFWNVTKNYLDKKEMQVAADHIVNALVERGIDDHDLIDLAHADHYMRNAISEHVELGEKDDAEEDE